MGGVEEGISDQHESTSKTVKAIWNQAETDPRRCRGSTSRIPNRSVSGRLDTVFASVIRYNRNICLDSITYVFNNLQQRRSLVAGNKDQKCNDINGVTHVTRWKEGAVSLVINSRFVRLQEAPRL